MTDGPVDQLQLDVNASLMYATTDVSVSLHVIRFCEHQQILLQIHSNFIGTSIPTC